MNDRLVELVCSHLDGAIDAEGFAELDAMLADDPTTADVFRALCEQAVLIAEPLRDRIDQLVYEDGLGQHLTAAPFARRRSGWVWTLSAIAAVLLIGGAIMGIVMVQRSQPIQALAQAPFATLTWSDGAVNGDRPLMTGQYFGAQSITTHAGETEFQLDNGTTIQLEGAAEVTLDGPMSATLTRGRANITCPPRAKGYTVHLLDGTQIVDLGTRFVVVAQPAEPTRVTVTDGRVEIRRSDTATIELAAGQTLSIGDAHAWVTLALAADDAHSSRSGFGGSVAATLSEPFDYDPVRPTAAMPTHIGSWFAASGAPGSVVHLSYTASPTTLAPGEAIIIDLYGRDLPVTVNRDDDFDVELYHGGYDAIHRVAVAAALAIPDTAPHHLRVTGDEFDADLTGRTFDRLRIVARDSNGPRDPNFFTLVELRAAVAYPLAPSNPALPAQPADRRKGSSDADRAPRNHPRIPHQGEVSK